MKYLILSALLAVSTPILAEETCKTETSYLYISPEGMMIDLRQVASIHGFNEAGRPPGGTVSLRNGVSIYLLKDDMLSFIERMKDFYYRQIF